MGKELNVTVVDVNGHTSKPTGLYKAGFRGKKTDISVDGYGETLRISVFDLTKNRTVFSGTADDLAYRLQKGDT